MVHFAISVDWICSPFLLYGCGSSYTWKCMLCKYCSKLININILSKCRNTRVWQIHLKWLLERYLMRLFYCVWMNSWYARDSSTTFSLALVTISDLSVTQGHILIFLSMCSWGNWCCWCINPKPSVWTSIQQWCCK